MNNGQTTVKGVNKTTGFGRSLQALKNRLDKNRLGELLVSKGRVSQDVLEDVLAEQRISGLAVGEILCARGVLTNAELRLSLWQQVAYRSMAGVLAFVLGLAATGVAPAQATSSLLRSDFNAARSYPDNRREEAKLVPVAINPNAVGPSMPSAKVENFPLLFGTQEIKSRDISDFTKYTEAMQRVKTAMSSDKPIIHDWQNQISKLRGLPLEAMVEKVNTMMNAKPYVEDKNNYGTSDYWASPAEFLARGGDCEDYALAKYASLKALGVPESRMRLAIVEDTWKSIPHAVLIVYTDNGGMVLDNQNKQTLSAADTSRYAPIYSINSQGWWRHVS